MLRQLFVISTIAFTLLPLVAPTSPLADLPHGAPKSTRGAGSRQQLPPNPLLSILPQPAIAATTDACVTDKAGTTMCAIYDSNGRLIGTTVSRLNGRSRVVPARGK